ncbi:MAG TPA: caspase family protein [Pyrinomonadaceae bacterium]|jgi:hypothetical protein
MKKRALLIGINKYPYMSEKGQLKGCVNDVLSIAAVLENQFGFDRNEITVLKDKEATRDSIIRELKKLAAECEQNDVIVFHFSGHGSRRRSKIPGKPDGVEETIVPYDSGRKKHPNRDISDENVKAWVSHLTKRTSNVTLFFDNCFSGSIVRDESTEQIRSIEQDDRVYDPSDELAQIDIFSPAVENLSKLADRYSMIAACEKSEYAREYTRDEACYGAFTYFLVQELGKLPKTATYDDLYEQLNLRLTSRYTLQHPQLEGIGNRLLFSGIEKPDLRYVAVENREGDKITLLAGAIHGLTRKSQWAIYPAASSNFPPEKKLGKVKITEVGGVVSNAKILSETAAKAITAGCRAIEEAHFYETPSMSVSIESVGAGLEYLKKEILRRLKKSPWLKVGSKKHSKNTVVRLIPSSQDSVRIEAVDKKDDSILFDMISNAVEATDKIIDYLEKLCRYQTILDLYNPFGELENIEFNLLQKTGDELRRAETVWNGLPVYTEGEAIGFEVINKSSESIYIGVLDLGLTKRISLLYPFRAASEGMGVKRAIADKLISSATGTLTVGKTPSDRITLRIPEEAQIEAVPGLNRWGGKEAFKLMIALRQTNFRVIEQLGIIRYKDLSPLESLISEVLNGNQTREAERDYNHLNNWITINRGFYLCKP